ncbi:MAG: hypothetical protein ACI8W8_002847 [Rhodothermales bacterium]
MLAGGALLLGIAGGTIHILVSEPREAPLRIATSTPVPVLANPNAMDVNGDASVDVLDAYLLARQAPPRTAQMRMLIAHITSVEAEP